MASTTCVSSTMSFQMRALCVSLTTSRIITAMNLKNDQHCCLYRKYFLDKLTRRAFVSGFLSVLPGKLVDADFGEINPESFELVSPFVLTEIIYE